MRLLAASLRYNLSPTGREIFLLPVPSADAPLLVVGVDGWSHVLNEHKQFAGMVFGESEELVDEVTAWIECTIHRHDRRVATEVREYLCEVRGHKCLDHSPTTHAQAQGMVQCTSITFGMGDIVDPDEAHRAHSDEPDRTRATTQTQNQKVTSRPNADHRCQRTEEHLGSLKPRPQNPLILIWSRHLIKPPEGFPPP